jgi:hypothetical protein
MSEQNNDSTTQTALVVTEADKPTIIEDKESLIRSRAEDLHAKIIDTQLDLIDALTQDKNKLSDHKHARVLNEVLSAAATTSLGTKKLALDAQSNDQQKAMVAMMISMARSEPSTMEFVKSVVDNTPKQADNITPVIDVDVKFIPEALVQGQMVISYDELMSIKPN